MYHIVLKAFLNYLLRKEGYLLAKQDSFGNMYVPDYNGEGLINKFVKDYEDHPEKY